MLTMTINETPNPEPNPKTQAAHKREAFWQITFPLIVGLILVLALAVLTVLSATGIGPIGQAGDAALIFLIIPLMLVTVLFVIVFGAIAFGIAKLNSSLPVYTRRAQDVFEMIRLQVQAGSDKVVEPVLKIRSFFAKLEALKRK